MPDPSEAPRMQGTAPARNSVLWLRTLGMPALCEGRLDGRVYRAHEDTEVTVRYSPRIARWFVERGQGAAQHDGSVVVTHRVADPDWIVTHVLRYGADAVIVEPPWARERVLDAVGRFVG